MPIRFTAMPTETAARLRAGARDAYGLPPERHVSDGPGNPCRHCLRPVPEGAAMLVLAYRPFHKLQPYAETGPVFLCAEACARWEEVGLPPVLAGPDYIVRGYGPDHRIVYGTGAVTPTAEIPARAEALLADPAIAYLHVRSARNNCYLCRIDRA
ncbi:MAG: DUF1203 domain-containing protein [Rhodobacteraceae bacterium]|jgi:hypothetical protein|nr:DUF1203 domain-containing protein [Paracoccaceae bacterium]